MKRALRHLAKLIAVFLLCQQAQANGITISNIVLLPATGQIQFDITWQNSWRSDILHNWDAAWIFLKYQVPDGRWSELPISTDPNNQPAGYTLSNPDNVGAYLYRSVAGGGTVSLTGITLNIGATLASGIYNIRVFGIEMVYIPSASFFPGDGTSQKAYRLFNNTPISSPNATPPTGTALYDSLSSTYPGFSNPFPLGYDSFYCMKYEISQAGYRDFLNTLTFVQQIAHTANLPNSPVGTNALSNSGAFRPYIKIATPGDLYSNTGAVYGCDGNNNNVFDEADDGEWVSCNYLNWPDLATYLVWAGLVPMTELQYEKICRGPLVYNHNEYAWGTSQVTANVYTLSNQSATGEIINNPTVTPGEGNALYLTTSASIAGPIRNGIFATGSSDRVSSGGGFYGVMDLSGNIMERTVTTANPQGLLFRGLTNTLPFVSPGGYASVTTGDQWPGMDSGDNFIDGTTNAVGLIYRGGSFQSAAAEMQISTRDPANVVTTPDTVRLPSMGGRGVKNADYH